MAAVAAVTFAENLRATQLLRANTLRRKQVPGTLAVVRRVCRASVSFIPVAHGRSESHTTFAATEGGEAKILWRVMKLPNVQQASIADSMVSGAGCIVFRPGHRLVLY